MSDWFAQGKQAISLTLKFFFAERTLSAAKRSKPNAIPHKNSVVPVFIRFKTRRQCGGTFYTVNYARKLGKKIIELKKYALLKF